MNFSSSPNLRDRFSHNARSYAERYFSINIIGDAFESVFDE